MKQEKVSICIDDEIVNEWELIKSYRFWKKYHLDGGEVECPLCGCDLLDNDMFVCKECGKILSCNKQCNEHSDRHICTDCCEHCQDQKAYEDAVNLEIDRRCGK